VLYLEKLIELKKVLGKKKHPPMADAL